VPLRGNIRPVYYRDENVLAGATESAGAFFPEQRDGADWARRSRACVCGRGAAEIAMGLITPLVVAMKISHNLERVGDEAVSIATEAGQLNADEPLKPYIDLPQMSSVSRQMLSDAIGAFVDARADQARALLPRDQEVDDLNRQLHRELASFMVERPANIPRCLHLMAVAKAFERVADHATNIAEDVVYLYEGKDIRHGTA
jgi:hypothetical protein